MEDVHFDHDGLQVCLESTALQLSGVRNSLMVARERLQQHLGRSAASHLPLESLLASSVFSFFDRVSRLVSDEMAAHRATITDVVASVFKGLERESVSSRSYYV